MYSVADTLLRWDEISLQRFVQEGHLHSIDLVYRGSRATGTAIPRDYSSAEHCLCPNSGAITNCT